MNAGAPWKRRWESVCLLVATGFYLSYIPVKILERAAAGASASDASRSLGGGLSRRRWTGSGLVGTLLGWMFLPWLPRNPFLFAGSVAAAIAAACWVSGVAERVLGRKDDSRIILDEVVGYWVAVAFLPHDFGNLMTAFILFRFFDTVKLPPYRRWAGLPGGFGIVLDDVGAGIAANLCARLPALWALG